MNARASSISKARSYKAIGEYWDQHDLGDYEDQIEPAEMEIEIEDEVTYFPVDRHLTRAIRSCAQRRGMPADALLNQWLQEKLREESA